MQTMQATTKTLNNYRDKEIKGLSLEQLSSLYRLTHYDCIIAEAFDQLKKLITLNTNLYPQFETSDSVSFALENLYMCLLTYVPGSQNKFSTYFCKVYRNRLRTESQQLNTHKRRIMFNSTSLDVLKENGFDVASNKDITNRTVCLPDDLTDREKLYCVLLAMNYGSNKQISEFMGVSVTTLCNMRKRLRKKLIHLYNLDN